MKLILKEMKHLPRLRLEDVALYAKPIEVARISFRNEADSDLFFVAGLCQLRQNKDSLHLVYTNEEPLNEEKVIAYFVSAEHISSYKTVGKA